MTEIAGAIAAIVSFIGAIYAKKAHGHARDVNDAVNHRHEHDSPRIFDMVRETRANVGELVEWKKSYEGGPLDTGRKADAFVAKTEKRLDALEEGEIAEP